jgi:hypothetical protein
MVFKLTESTLDLNTKIKNGSKKKLDKKNRLLNYAVRILESLFHNVFNLKYLYTMNQFKK